MASIVEVTPCTEDLAQDETSVDELGFLSLSLSLSCGDDLKR